MNSRMLPGCAQPDAQRAASSNVRVYCFGHAGAAAIEFSQWISIDAELEVEAVRLPGRGERFEAPAMPDLGALVDFVVDDLALDGVFAFFGHSFGALLAFEVARTLHRRGRTLPKALFLSAFPAPDQLPDSAPILHQMADLELLRLLSDMYGAVPAEVLEHPELVAVVAAYVRSDYQALETYHYLDGPALPCDVRVLLGDSDTVPVAAAARWRHQFSGSFSLHMFAGDHFYLRTEAHASAIVAMICEELRQ